MARAHVVMSDEVLEAIDRVVGHHRRSRFLEEAAREKLARFELERAIRRTAGVVRASEHPHWRDRRTTAAWVRKIRRGESRR